MGLAGQLGDRVAQCARPCSESSALDSKPPAMQAGCDVVPRSLPMQFEGLGVLVRSKSSGTLRARAGALGSEPGGAGVSWVSGGRGS